MSSYSKAISDWPIPDSWLSIDTLDMHTGGEPLRIITGGFPELIGNTILEKRRYAQANLDHLRTALMWEPRGHADMYGAIITPPVTESADFGILFLHNEGYSTMCGHGIIAVTKAAVVTGLVATMGNPVEVKIDSPAGLITAFAHREGDDVNRVSFRNVPSYVLGLDEFVEVPGLGSVRYDLAFGGAHYAYVRAKDVGLSCIPSRIDELIEKGMAIKRAVMANRAINHPVEDDLNYLYGTIFIGPAEDSGVHSRNVCIFAEGEVDRSPTGTGVSGRMAIHYARGEVAIGEKIVIESIIGSRFSSMIVEETTFGDYRAIIPEVSGEAYITGQHRFIIDPNDPLSTGFIIR